MCYWEKSLLRLIYLHCFKKRYWKFHLKFIWIKDLELVPMQSCRQWLWYFFDMSDTDCNKFNRLTNNKQTYLSISDINECSSEATNDCVSNDHCTDVPGTYTCSCPDGFKLKSDAKTCIREFLSWRLQHYSNERSDYSSVAFEVVAVRFVVSPKQAWRFWNLAKLLETSFEVTWIWFFFLDFFFFSWRSMFW